MRVGPCIKALGPRIIEMIDIALLYKEENFIFNDNKEIENKLNPYEFYKNAEIYLGWREASQYSTTIDLIQQIAKKTINF